MNDFSRILAFITVITFISCNKVSEYVSLKKSDKGIYEVASFSGYSGIISYDPDPYGGYGIPVYTNPTFSKKFDGQGKVTSAVLPIFFHEWGRTPRTLDTAEVEISYTSNQMIVSRARKTSEVLMTATFDEHGRIFEATGQGEIWGTTNFSYEDGRLIAINTDPVTYDEQGNVTQIGHDAGYIDPNSYFFMGSGETYTYDLTKSATNQWYLNEGYFGNVFAWLDFLGFFPELQPKNLRISTLSRIMIFPTDFDYFPNNFGRHIIDNKSNLTSYNGFEIKWRKVN